MSEEIKEKLNSLRELLLMEAEHEKTKILDMAKKEAEAMEKEEMEKISREEALILKEANERAESLRRRQVMAAERERRTELLRLQNKLIKEAVNMLEDRLNQLKDDSRYPQILVALVEEGASVLKDVAIIKIRLSAQDASLGEYVAQEAQRRLKDLKVTFDNDPAPIFGGVWIYSSDGKRFVGADWKTRAQELATSLADRLLPLL